MQEKETLSAANGNAASLFYYFIKKRNGNSLDEQEITEYNNLLNYFQTDETRLERILSVASEQDLRRSDMHRVLLSESIVKAIDDALRFGTDDDKKMARGIIAGYLIVRALNADWKTILPPHPEPKTDFEL